MAQPLRIAVVVGRDEEAAPLIARGIQPQSGLTVVFALSGARALAKRLRTVATVPVVDVHRSLRLAADHVYVLPVDRESTFQGSWLAVADVPGQPSRDRLLRSLADSFGADSAVVLLADRACDGVLGAKRVKEAGGITLCQATTAEGVSELARAASATTFVDLALPVAEIAPRLIALASGPDLDALGPDDEIALEGILALMRKRTKLDFQVYKRAVLIRRLSRRMQIRGAASLPAYHKLLHDEPTELNRLSRELLLRVADFFRDPPLFDALASDVVPRLFRGKGAMHAVRVWVPGCETGEEAYSIAMLLCEHAAHLREAPPLHVYATDLDEEALREARTGMYSDAITGDISPERLRRFFTREHDHYRVTSELRDTTVFAAQSSLLDAPYSRLDLVCCRGLLGCLNEEAQLNAIETFHSALKPGGILCLGRDEHAAGSLFTLVDATHNIYERRAVTQPHPTSGRESELEGSFGTVHHQLVDHFGMASVLVDHDLDVLHVSARAAELLQPGPIKRNILQLVHPGLSQGLRTAIYAAREDASRIVTRNVRFDDHGRMRCVEVRVRTVEAAEAAAPALLVMFDEHEEETDAPSHRIEPLIDELEEELRRTRDELRASGEWHDKPVRATYTGALFLDRDLNVRYVSGRIAQLLHSIAAQRGTPLAELRHRFAGTDLLLLAMRARDEQRPFERVVRDGDGRHYHVRIEPDSLSAEASGVVVVTFVDVTELHTRENDVTEALRSANVAVIAHDANADIAWSYLQGETTSTPAALLTRDSAERYTATVQTVFTTGAIGHVEVELAIGGAALPYEFHVAPVVDDSTITGATAIGVPARRPQ